MEFICIALRRTTRIVKKMPSIRDSDEDDSSGGTSESSDEGM